MAVVAVILAGGLAALGMLASSAGQPLILTVMAFLATLGVFLLFGLAAGSLRFEERVSGADPGRLVGDAIDEGLQISTRDGRVLYSNPAMLRMLGCGALDQAFAGEAQAAEALFRLSRAADRGEERREEFRVAALQGRGGRWLRLAVRPLARAAAAGSPAVIWQLSDITRERAVEAESRRALEATLAHYDALPVGALVAEIDGRVHTHNATLARWLGLGHDAGQRGLRLGDIIAGDGLAMVRAALRQPEGSGRIDLDLVREDGTTWPATLICHHAPRVGSGLFVAAVLDRAGESGDEPDAGAADVRFARFFQTAPFGIATVSAEGRITSANAAFARLLLDGRSGVQGRVVDVLARGADAETRKAVEASLGAALARKANVPPVEIALGEARELTRRVFMSPLAQGQGARDAAVLYVLDATEQKALEVKYAQSQKMEAVGKLAGGIAHDFNNVLTAIIGFSDLLLQTHRPADPAYKNISNIKSSANRAAGLVSQLLAFSRRQTLLPEVLELGEVLTDLSVLLNRLLGEKIDLKIHAGRDLWLVKADRTQLGQVMINLAVNARDAMMPAGGRLSIRTRNVSERESQRHEGQGMMRGEYVLIEVEDTGHGMTPEVLAKIFEPFFTTKGIGKGTGLGLSTVYGIVKQTGGFIFADSAVGKGTTFRVYLPRHEADAEEEVAAAKAQRKETHADLTGTGRVLLVEDEDAVRSFGVEALKRQGYEVLAAASGVEALEVMAANGYAVDIVVSDVIMPEMDGPTLLKELRKSRPDLKFIFVSGYPDDAFKNSLEESDTFAFLQKPFSLAQLAGKVKAELGR
jgi:two-component system cell cycle sensor histidine kinase/response regulator CckA